MRLLARLALGFLAFSPLATAGTITVSPTGTGTDFSALSDAISAAQPGDLILVQAGAYSEATTLLIDKPLSIVGVGSASLSYTALSAFAGDDPLTLRIRNLGPGEAVRIVGLQLRSSSATGPGSTLAVIENNAGPVTLIDVMGSGGFAPVPGSGVVQVLSSDQVLLAGCRFSGELGSFTLGLAQPGLRVMDSFVQLDDCTIQGGTGKYKGGPVGPSGSPGIEVVGSELHVATSVVTGGNGAWPLFTFPARPGIGGPGVSAEASVVHLRGGAGVYLGGGQGGLGQVGGLPVYGVGGPALHVGPLAVVTTTPDVPLVPGADGDGATTTAPVDALGVWSPGPDRLATLSLSDNLVSSGGAVSLTMGAEPGSLALPYFSLGLTPAFALSGIPGVIVLDPLQAIGLTPQVLGGTGLATSVQRIPGDPVFRGLVVHLQVVTSDPAGLVSISVPGALAIRF